MRRRYLAPVALERRHGLEGFECGEPALDEWFRLHARSSHASGRTRVFVTATAEDANAVVGFYGLAAFRIEPADAVERVLRGQPTASPVPAVLLARLAVDRHHQGRGVGRSLLVDALRRIHGASQTIGIRVVVVHAKHDRAATWYERCGFTRSASDPRMLMVLVKDLRALLD